MTRSLRPLRPLLIAFAGLALLVAAIAAPFAGIQFISLLVNSLGLV